MNIQLQGNIQKIVRQICSKKFHRHSSQNSIKNIRNQSSISGKSENETDQNMMKSKKKSRQIIAKPDFDKILDTNCHKEIVKNLVDRLVVPNEESASKMLDDLNNLKVKSDENPLNTSHSELLNLAALEFPNYSHPVIENLTEPKTLFDNCDLLREKLKNLQKVRSFDEISKIMNGSRTNETGQTTSEKSYYLLGPFAELEQALIHYTIDYLTEQAGFSLISVPDILDPEIIEACGFKTTGKRTNVFNLDPNYYEAKTLSGTAEMGFGSFFANKALGFQSEGCAGFAAVSR